jgi:hypothetical protein
VAAIIADSESPGLACYPAKIIHRIRHATRVGRIAMIAKGRRGGRGAMEPGGVGCGLRKGRDKRAPAASLTA